MKEKIANRSSSAAEQYPLITFLEYLCRTVSFFSGSWLRVINTSIDLRNNMKQWVENSSAPLLVDYLQFKLNKENWIVFDTSVHRCWMYNNNQSLFKLQINISINISVYIAKWKKFASLRYNIVLWGRKRAYGCNVRGLFSWFVNTRQYLPEEVCKTSSPCSTFREYSEVYLSNGRSEKVALMSLR